MASLLSKIPVVGKLFDNSYSGSGSFVFDWGELNNYSRRGLLNQNAGYVWTCISAIASEVAKFKPKIVKDNAKGEQVELADHQFLQVLRKPNPFMSQYVLFEFTSAYQEATGEAFWYFALGENSRKPKEIYVLRPDRIKVAVDRTTGLPSGYVYNTGTQEIPLEVDEVLCFKYPNLIDPNRGLGPIEAGGLYVETEEAASKFTRNFLFNQGRPSGVVSVSGQISKDDFDEFKRKWKQEYSGTDNAGKTAVLRNAEVAFTQLGVGLDGVALQAAKNLSRDDIMAMFRVSKPILGITEDVNRANAEAAEYIFAKRVIDAKMFRLADTLETFIDRIYGDASITVIYDSPVPEDMIAKVNENTAAINSWKTRDEIRAELGLGPTEGGDKFWMPFNLVEAGSPVKTEKSNRTVGKIVIRRKKKKPYPKEQEAQSGRKDFSFPHEVKENFRLSIIRNQALYSTQVIKDLRKLLDKQLSKIIAQLKPQKLLNGEINQKAYNDILFEPVEDAQTMVEELRPIILELAKKQGDLALLLAGADDLKFELSKLANDEITRRIGKLSLEYSRETREKLEQVLTEGLRNNDSLAQIIKNVKAVYGDAKNFRAERLARTETLDVSSVSAREGYKQTGYVTKIEWFANPDACEFCQELDGKVVGIDNNFAELGQQIEGVNGGILNVDYDTMDGPPAHPNCECTLLPVIGD